MSDTRLLTVGEAASLWRCGVGVVYLLLGEKRIPGAWKLGGQWRIPADARPQ